MRRGRQRSAQNVAVCGPDKSSVVCLMLLNTEMVVSELPASVVEDVFF